ncbi:MAG: hypothetical protein BJ554DRAFT_3651 [Olpidium bornovanus]|uniref:Spindle assembly abnormal protein 6 N-terminal domain-containing protein n=1 Tax=Olpidium bornovanus TaxID=278681 RepID=A0A8H8DLJ9_9FUNG|nr:MAG: hypothetical protein BJ554DRAFT_3651 [Olpidium bornovanus]
MDVTATSVLFNGRVPITVKQPALPASPDQQQQRHQQQLQQRLPQLGGPAAVPVDNIFQGPAGPRHVQQRKHGITVRIALASRQGGRSKVSVRRKGESTRRAVAGGRESTAKNRPSLCVERTGEFLTPRDTHLRSPPPHSQVLEVQLTDETDPFFLYQLDIGEEDFHRLKNDQNLLVDFQAFPEKFIELLNHCVRHRNEDHPKFVAQLTSETSARCAVLNVIETNTFKHIAHLSLDFIPGDDARVKQYLANLVKDYKAEVSSLQQELESSVAALTGRLQEQESHAASLATELERLRTSSTEGSSRLQIQHAEEMARLRENAARELENYRRDAEKETRRLEMDTGLEVLYTTGGVQNCRRKSTHSNALPRYCRRRFAALPDGFPPLSLRPRQLRNLSQKHTTVSATHNHLLSHSQTLEGALAAANKQLDAITHECQAFRQDFDRANARAEQLEAQRAEQEREIERLRGDFRESERRERERQAECNRLNDLIENSGDQKLARSPPGVPCNLCSQIYVIEIQAKLEDSLNLYKTQNARLEETMRKATEEISKGNEIIQRLQVELRSCKSKIKLKNMVTLQQEKLLDERAHTLETQQKEIAGLQEAAAKRGEELEAARKRIDELQNRLDDSKRVIEENANGRPCPRRGLRHGLRSRNAARWHLLLGVTSFLLPSDRVVA